MKTIQQLEESIVRAGKLPETAAQKRVQEQLAVVQELLLYCCARLDEINEKLDQQ